MEILTQPYKEGLPYKERRDFFEGGHGENILFSRRFFLGGDRDIKQGSSKEDGGRLFFWSRDPRKKAIF